MTPTILLTGKTGQVGSELLRLLPRLGKVIAPDRGELDLSNRAGVRLAISQIQPHLIVNAAAYTQVDRAESEQSTAFAVNAEAPATIAAEAARIGATLVHFSTDYIFDGSKGTPYLEADPPNPLNVYGKSKLAGEQAIRASGAPHLILRTSWIYARLGRNFLLTILRLATEKEELRIVCDQIGAPTWSAEVAAGTVRILTRIGNEGFTSEAISPFSGVYHMTAGGEISWHQFAEAILQECSKMPREDLWIKAATSGKPLLTRFLTPISADDYSTPARRPAYSVLSNARLQKTFGFILPDWRSQLKKIFEQTEASASTEV